MSLRATNPEDKLSKRESILDAAQHLWLSNTDRISNMDALAKASGVAKGTLYLYFKSKEEVLLALHERDLNLFFSRLTERASQPDSMQTQDLIDLVVKVIHDSPTFLPLSSLCRGLMERQLPLETSVAFTTQIATQLEQAVHALQAHFPHISCMKLMQGYALLLGLWQLLQPSVLNQHLSDNDHMPCGSKIDADTFLQLVNDSLLTLYQGLLNPPPQDTRS